MSAGPSGRRDAGNLFGWILIPGHGIRAMPARIDMADPTLACLRCHLGKDPME